MNVQSAAMPGTGPDSDLLQGHWDGREVKKGTRAHATIAVVLGHDKSTLSAVMALGTLGENS